MKISCLQENLAKGISVVSRLVATKGTLEILSHILLKTEEGRLKLSATNLEIGMNYKIGAKIESDGAITIPARLLNELISQLPAGKVDLELKEDTLHIKTGSFDSHLKGLADDEFPLIPRIKDGKLLSLKCKELKEAINAVAFAAAADEARPVLAGIYVRIEKGKMTLAATDSYRLAEKVINLKTKDQETKEAVVPARSLMELARTLDDPEKEVDVFLDDSQIMFETEDLEFTSRLVEGNFPDYKQLIPTEFDTQATFKKSDFANIIKVVALFSRESAGSITLDLLNKGEVVALSSGSQYGDSKAACEAKVEGEDAQIIFNSKYILDFLNNVGDDSLVLGVNGKLNPGVMKREADKDYVYVIMPLRV